MSLIAVAFTLQLMGACHLAAGTDEFGDRPCEAKDGAACPGDGTCDDFAACTCANGRLDEGETDVDCGGRCLPTLACPADDICGTDDVDPSNEACTTGICCRCAGEFVCQSVACDQASCEALPL